MEFEILKMEQVGGVNRIFVEEVLPATSIVWEERYNDIGKMQAVFPRTDITVSKIQTGKFALVEGTLRLMYIYGTKVTDTEVWAYGYEAKALLQKQAMMNAGTNDGEVNVSAAVVAALTLYNGLSWCNAPQLYDWSNLGTKNLDGLEYYSVYEYVKKCVALSDSGWEAEYQYDGTVTLKALHGVDRTNSLVLSTGLGNISGLIYTEDDQSYMSRVYAVGDDDGTNVFVYDEESNPANEIYSAYLDCRLEFPRPEGMTSADYEDALRTRAHMSLIARHAQRKLNIKNVDPDTLGVNLGLGDVLSVQLPELNLTATMRVVCIRRTMENGLASITMELSTVTLS